MAADHRTSSVQLEVRGDGSRAAALWRSYGHLDSDPDFQARVLALETQFALVRANERERLLGHGQDQAELRRLRSFVAAITRQERLERDLRHAATHWVGLFLVDGTRLADHDAYEEAERALYRAARALPRRSRRG